MFILDPDTERRARPWHIYDGGDRYAIFALCSKVFDAKPSGLTTAGDIVDELICGLCLAARDRKPALVPRDIGWQAMYLEHHIPMDAISAAVVALESMPIEPFRPTSVLDPEASDELVFMVEQRGWDRLADRLAVQ